MALRRQVVDLIGLHFLDDTNQAVGIGHIAIVEKKTAVGNVRVFVQMVDALRVQQRAAALDAVYFVSLGEKEFGEVGAILTGDAGDECFLHKGWVIGINRL